MGKVLEKQKLKKKKKGRPSLLDLQKRSLKQQQQQQQQQHQQQQEENKRKNHHQQQRNVSPSNSNSNSTTTPPNSSRNHKSATTTTTTPLRRSTRFNPSNQDESDEDEQSNGKRRREKKLKLVLKLPKSDPDSTNGEDSNGEEEEKNTVSNNKKRKINGSESEKGDQKSASGTNQTNNVQGAGPSTPLPDEKLLLFILDRLQKKDTYGVFSEPVDLNELPDYLEVIENPMDFGTIRKKLSNGAYASLEQFEKDVSLISSNAMQYNAPDTIYFRQARSIQELAKKSFDNLRQDSDDNEPEPKVARRGRPPIENFKKSPGLDLAGSEFSSGATPATRGEGTAWSNNDLRKGPSDKSVYGDTSGRFNGPRNDAYGSTENRLERNDEAAGSAIKGNLMKYGKKQLAHDENRRNTYKQFHPSAVGRVPSVLTTFDAERKQLVAVGLFSELGYARSLARFAANFGPVSWTIAVKRIERSLPPGVKFGPGWVGENDIPPRRPLLSSPCPGQQQPPPPPPPQRSSFPESSAAAATPCTTESKEEKLSTEVEEDDSPRKQVPSSHAASGGNTSNGPASTSISASLLVAKKSDPGKERKEATEGSNSHAAFNVLNSMGVLKPRPPFQLNQSPGIHPGMIGHIAAYGLNRPPQMGKLIGVARPSGFNVQPSQMADKVSRTNSNLVHSANANNLNIEKSKSPRNSSSTNSSNALPMSGSEAVEASKSGRQSQPPKSKPDAGSLLQQKPDAVPPDLNVRYQSPGSPSTSRADSVQPDLALQL